LNVRKDAAGITYTCDVDSLEYINKLLDFPQIYICVYQISQQVIVIGECICIASGLQVDALLRWENCETLIHEKSMKH